MQPLIFCSVLYISVWSCSPLSLNFFFFTGPRCSQKAQLLHRGFVGEFWPTKNSGLQEGRAPLRCSSEHQRKHRIQGSFLIVIHHFVTQWQTRSGGFPFLPISTELIVVFLLTSVLFLCDLALLLYPRHKGHDSSCGILVNLEQPAQEDSVLVKVLKRQGATPFVKTNLPQGLLK